MASDPTETIGRRVEAAAVAPVAAPSALDPGRALGGDPRSLATDAALDLAVVIPTLNEADNVPVLLERLGVALASLRWEVIVVDDDSADGTADVARAVGLRDPRVRCLHRLGRRGLSSACIEGVLATAAPVVVVMDADLQHDETIIPAMVERLRRDGLDVVVGSRFAAAGDVGAFSAWRRVQTSFASGLSRVFLRGARLSDPMSGFFAVDAAVFRGVAPKLSGVGFKILLDLFLSSPRRLAFAEIGYTFGARRFGESKLDRVVALEFLILLYEKWLGRWIPVRFAMFSIIGAMGVVVHMSVLTALFRVAEAPFVHAQAVATLVAMTFNFFVNNQFTYRDQRLQGVRALAIGWASFCAVCSLGALANVGVAAFLHTVQQAPWTWSALGGIAAGVVWNFVLSSHFTWGRYK